LDINFLKPYVIKGKLPRKEVKIIDKKMNKFIKEVNLNQYDKDLSPTQIKKINNEFSKRYPWLK
jgi:hypothetical protein